MAAPTTAERRASIQRMLAAGSIVGMAAGLAAQFFVDGVDEDIRGLVRAALLLPGVIFTAWWLLSPRPALEQEEREVAGPGAVVDPQARLAKIESTFDAAAVPAARRHRLDDVDAEARKALHDSLRSHGTGTPSEDAAYQVGPRERRSS